MLKVTIPLKRFRIDPVEGEFHFDLYTLGNNVLSQLWEYAKKKVDVQQS
jgi:transcription initiation factor IIF auxiliary subunit